MTELFTINDLRTFTALTPGGQQRLRGFQWDGVSILGPTILEWLPYGYITQVDGALHIHSARPSLVIAPSGDFVVKPHNCIPPYEETDYVITYNPDTFRNVYLELVAVR